MILTEARHIFDAARFAAGLEVASRGVVRVALRNPDQVQSVATGWLITERLVIVPAFALIPGWASAPETMHVVPARGATPIPASVEPGSADPAGSPDPLLPALLRLAAPLADRALPLATAAPRVAEPVFLLHHPQGSTDQMLSLGRLVGVAGPWIRYDADTEAGSSGAPVLSAEWRVLGMHVRSSTPDDPEGRYNAGISVAALMERLSPFAAWHEIAAYHGLADVIAARQEIATVTSAATAEAGAGPDTGSAAGSDGGPTAGSDAGSSAAPVADDALLGMAVAWSISPGDVGKDLRDTVAGLVIDRRQDRWMLRGNERTRLIASASLGALREARARLDGAAQDREDPGQRVIDRILAGPPFDLASLEEADLPLWLQAVRWFEGVVPDLPTPGAIHRTLARRRIRSRLTEIAGPSFRGRRTELARMHGWLEDPAGPLTAITGIGGVGKSALVAKLALELPPDTVLLWLDFDRADLAPDDPVSVLSILFDQLALELDGLTLPRLEPDSWGLALVSLGPLVAPALASRRVLLVLDGFEVAQHAPRHEEIWRLLRQFLDQLPRTRVVVSGRAPVGDVRIAGRTVNNLHLRGLEREDAEDWLRDAGIKRRDVLDAVLDMSRGVPLILRLAVGLLESGGKVTRLPEKLPHHMVEGFLYQRILDRVVDVDLKPVATDILVLRQLTPGMLEPIVGDSLPKGVAPEAVFARLAQEMALVGDPSAASSPAIPVTVSAGPDRLVLRREVRAATVRLLETANAERVRTIDRRAARWYAAQDLDEPSTRAELIYHRLRASDIKGAAEAWRDDCLPFLVGTEDELPVRATRARAWIRAKTTAAMEDPVASQRAWEADAVGRVRAALARGLERGVAEVLAERPGRAPDGQLVVYDAWVAWRAGELDRARSILADAPAADGPVGRDRALLAARLATAAGDGDAADALLAGIEAEDAWRDRPHGALDATTVTAARIRLAVDLDAELELGRRLAAGSSRGRVPLLRVPLPPADVVLPLLARSLGESGSYESLGEAIPIPMRPEDAEPFAKRIEAGRISTVLAALTAVAPVAPWPLAPQPGLSQLDSMLQRLAEIGSPEPASLELAGRMVQLASRRWKLVEGPFLMRACDALLAAGRARDPQPMAIAGSLAAFGGTEWSPFRLVHPSAGPLERVLAGAPIEQLAFLEPPPTTGQLRRALAFVNASAETSGRPRRDDLERLVSSLPEAADTADTSTYSARALAAKELLLALQSGHALRGIGHILLSPDPLDVLVRRVLGVPDQLAR